MPLTPIREAWTVVINGHWNPHIFTHEWLSQNVFHVPEVIVEFPLELDLPCRLSGAGVTLVPTDKRLLLNPMEITNESLIAMERFAVGLLDNLPHTPIKQTGINFGFRLDSDSSSISRNYPFGDSNRLADLGLSRLRYTVGRAFTHGNFILNLRTDLDNGNCVIDFNFHAETPSASVAKARIENHVLECRDRALEILRHVWQLEVAQL